MTSAAGNSRTLCTDLRLSNESCTSTYPFRTRAGTLAFGFALPSPLRSALGQVLRSRDTTRRRRVRRSDNTQRGTPWDRAPTRSQPDSDYLRVF